MQRLADNLVGNVRTIEVAGVDVVHPGGDGLAQHGHCRVMIPGRAENAGSRELHGAVAKPVHGAVAECECAGHFDAGHERVPFKTAHRYVSPVRAIMGYNPHGLFGAANSEG